MGFNSDFLLSIYAKSGLVEKLTDSRCSAIYAMMMRAAAKYGEGSTWYCPHIATHNINSAQYPLIQL